ncbi:MAG: hypothetical protein MSO56_10830 [Clostridiales bacterium]|nr:hypothetical protein [Clostridiales bacterium]
MRGELAVYPTNTGDNQVASEKVMPIDYSHFNMNSWVFGAVGADAGSDEARIFNVKLERTPGGRGSHTRTTPAIPARERC